jgi:uncharacterized membrane protein
VHCAYDFALRFGVNPVRKLGQLTATALGWCRRIRSNTASPFWSVTIASPSIRHERAGSAATAAAASGKRPAKSWRAGGQAGLGLPDTADKLTQRC